MILLHPLPEVASPATRADTKGPGLGTGEGPWGKCLEEEGFAEQVENICSTRPSSDRRARHTLL